jgi:hypothetical protein
MNDFDLLQVVTEGLLSHLIFESCNAKEVSSDHTYKVRDFYLPSLREHVMIRNAPNPRNVNSNF